MARALVPALEVSSERIIEKLRELPIQGDVLVNSGDTVTANQVVAETKLLGDLQILRVAERMGLEPFEVMRGIEKQGLKEGDEIVQDQIVCTHIGLFGWFRTEFKSTCSGKVEFISSTNGHIGVRQAPKQLKLTAYIDGKVKSIVPGRSVTLETKGAFIQGIFGVGGERHGKLRELKVSGDAFVTSKDIPENCQGEILFGGMAPDIGAVRKAANAGAQALVVGSIDDSTLFDYLGFDIGIALTGDERIPMTIIITEGFGKVPMGERTLELLKELQGREASLNGATQVRAGAIRPEVIVPHTGIKSTNQISQSQGLEVGRRVRAIRHPYFGLRGTVTELPHELLVIETGTATRVLKAKLDDGREVVIPRANVELT